MKVTHEDCIPLNFFRKLPPEIKAEIDDLTLPLFNKSIIDRMVRNDYIIRMIFNLSPKKADDITKYSDDAEYFTVMNVYETLQPIYKEILEGRDYYKRYPEYLI